MKTKHFLAMYAVVVLLLACGITVAYADDAGVKQATNEEVKFNEGDVQALADDAANDIVNTATSDDHVDTESIVKFCVAGEKTGNGLIARMIHERIVRITKLTGFTYNNVKVKVCYRAFDLAF